MDVYELAVEYLTQHPEEILDAWQRPDLHRGGSLFRYANRSPDLDGSCGCLTQIRLLPEIHQAQTRELTEEISDDERIPDHPTKIQVHHLPIFAEWQRRLDRELGPYLSRNADQREYDRQFHPAGES